MTPLLLTWRPHDDKGVVLKVQVNTVDLPKLPSLPGAPWARTRSFVRHLQEMAVL